MPPDTTGIVSGWLRSLPEGTLLRWGDDGLTANRPYASRGVDPVVADAPLAWPWHVLGPDDPDAVTWDSITLIVPYDLDTFEVWPAGPCHGPLGAYRVGRTDLRFRWDADERSAVVRTFARHSCLLQASQSRDAGWVALRPAVPRTWTFDADVWEQGEDEHGRRARRIADAQCWAHSSTIEPMLNWLTPAEVADSAVSD